MKTVALSKMTIDELAKTQNISLEEAFEKFYTSKTAKALSDLETGLFTYTPYDLVQLINAESNAENG